MRIKTSAEKKKSRILFPFFAIFIAALVIRIAVIDKSPFWIDEWWSLDIAKKSVAEFLETIGGDIHPPLYMLLLKILAFFSSDLSIELLRFVSSIFGSLACSFIFLAASYFLKKRHAILAGLFMACHPLDIYISVEARSYALLSLIFSCILAAGIKIENMKELSKKSRTCWLMTLLLLAGLYTHYYFFFLIPPVLFFIHKNLRSQIQDNSTLPFNRKFVAHLTVLLLGTAPLFFLFFRHLQNFHSRGSFMFFEIFPLLLDTLGKFSLGFFSRISPLLPLFFILVLFFHGLLLLKKQHIHSILLLSLLPPALVLMAVPFFNIYGLRYLAIFHGGFITSTAAAVSSLSFRHIRAFIFFALFLTAALSSSISFTLDEFLYTGHTRAATTALTEAKNGDIILLSPWFGYLLEPFNSKMKNFEIINTPCREYDKFRATIKRSCFYENRANSTFISSSPSFQSQKLSSNLSASDEIQVFSLKYDFYFEHGPPPAELKKILEKGTGGKFFIPPDKASGMPGKIFIIRGRYPYGELSIKDLEQLIPENYSLKKVLSFFAPHSPLLQDRFPFYDLLVFEHSELPCVDNPVNTASPVKTRFAVTLETPSNWKERPFQKSSAPLLMIERTRPFPSLVSPESSVFEYSPSPEHQIPMKETEKGFTADITLPVSNEFAYRWRIADGKRHDFTLVHGNDFMLPGSDEIHFTCKPEPLRTTFIFDILSFTSLAALLLFILEQSGVLRNTRKTDRLSA